MQHATDWKNVAAEVIPIGVEDCSALYTYDVGVKSFSIVP